MGEPIGALFEKAVELPPPDALLDALGLPAGGAVYAFTDENENVLQTVGTQNLRRSVLFRLAPPDDEKMNFFTFAFTPDSMTLSIPKTFISASNRGSATDLRTSICAA